MGVFEFVIAIVIIQAIVQFVRMKHASGMASQSNGVANTELFDRLEKLERRIANLETLVIEADKKKEFERIL